MPADDEKTLESGLVCWAGPMQRIVQVFRGLKLSFLILCKT
jgi:hypothetical protein